MSFAINPSLNHIDIPGEYIEAFYRSTAEVPLPDARFRGHPCEAFICISKIEKTMKAYVAILDIGLKSVLVYTSDYATVNPADYPVVYASAEEFVNAMGFTMEKVNLEFSPAMREVIIKGFRVMRPPPPPRKHFKNPKIDYLPVHPVIDLPATLADSLQADFQSEFLPAELKSLQAELSSARKVIEKITREKVSTEQSAFLEIASLKTAVEQAIESRKKSEERFTKEIQALKDQQSASQSRVDKEEIAQQKEKFLREADEAKASLDKLRKETADLQEKNRNLESEKLRIESQSTLDNSSSQDRIAKLTAENESLQQKLAAEQAAIGAAAEKISALALFETAWKEGQQREDDFCRNIDLLKMQLEEKEVELQGQRERENREKELNLTITELEKNAAALNSELAQLRNSAADTMKLAPELKELEEGKRLIESEYVRLANESREKESDLADALSTAEAEVQRLSREIEIQSQVAAMEQSALRAEIRRIVMSGAATAHPDPISEQPEALMPAPPPVSTLSAGTVSAQAASPPAMGNPEQTRILQDAETQEEDSDEPDQPVSGDPDILSGLINEFGSFYSDYGSSSTDFTIDPAITSIEYSDPAEIVALLYSSNTVQAVPDGSSIQRCKGYVIGMKRAGEYLTYVVWYLTESKKAVFCTPQQQPADSDECVRILKDAVAYFEIVGFMMEVEELGSSTKSYNKALKKVPALKKAANA